MKTDFPKICCKKDKVLQQTPLSVSRGSDIEGWDVVRASFLKSRLLLTETVELHLIDLFYFFHDEFHLTEALLYVLLLETFLRVLQKQQLYMNTVH